MTSSTFDPSKITTNIWGTYVEERNPQFKTHTRKSSARNSFNQFDRAMLYEWVNGTWVEKDRKAPAPPKPEAPKLEFKDRSHRELLRVILAKFAEYEKRGQAYYGLEGMSTSHITLKAIDDNETLRAFWPPELVRDDWRNGKTYMLTNDALTKLQSNIRRAIEKLAQSGYIDRLGNEHERRWRPAKSLKGVTL